MTLHDWLDTFQESATASPSLTVAFLPKVLCAILLVLSGIYSIGTSLPGRLGC